MDDRPPRSGAPDGRSDRAARAQRRRPIEDLPPPRFRRPAANASAAVSSRRVRQARSATAPVQRRPKYGSLSYGSRGARLALALVSALVLGFTGYGWATFQSLQKGLSTTDVIGFSAPDPATDILLVGIDSRTDAYDNPLPAEVLSQLRAGGNEGELTDTMILVRIPNDGSHAVAISLPRDLYVQLPEGYGKHKLNSAFIRAKNATAERLIAQGTDPAMARRESIAAGRRLLLQAVNDLTGIGIDHYAEINLLGFSLLTEAVGGVRVCLREPVRDRFSGANFPAGPQVISGPDALAFVRQRHGLPRGDLDRIVRQQVYLAALADKVLTAGTLSSPRRIRQLIDATQQSLVLDEDLDVLDFAARMQGLAAGNVAFETVPVLGDGESESDGAVLNVDPQAVQAFIAKVIDNDPAPDLAPGSPARATVTVDVLNASGVAGLAKSVSEQLSAQGFGQGAVGNSPARATSVVRYPPNEQEAGQAVADTLGGLPIEEGSYLTASTVQVFLGRDYSGPGKPQIGPASFSRVDEPTTTNPVRPIARHTRLEPPAPPPAPAPPIVGGDVPCVF